MAMDANNREYSNGEITVFWRPSKCIHATTCYKDLIEVFNPRNRPWVNMQGAPTKKIIEVVEKCPTAALYWKWNKDLNETEKVLPPEEVADTLEEEKPEIKVMRDGPLLLKGNFRIIATDGTELRKMRMSSLCRCGYSNNMPYCDGMHRKKGFEG